MTDLRTQLAEELGDPEAADAVMHVIEAHILAITVDATERADLLAGRLEQAERERDTAREALDAAAIVIASLRDQRDEQRQRAETAERKRDEERAIRQQAEEIIAIAHQTSNQAERERARAVQRADHAEQKLQQARDAIADERRGRLAAEAAVRRARALLEPYPEGEVFAIHRGAGSERRVQAVLPREVVLAALDAEGRQDETLTALERQRDQAIAALTRHAAEAHRRKWAHSEDNQAAFDALHRLGDEILASRDRLRAVDSPQDSHKG